MNNAQLVQIVNLELKRKKCKKGELITYCGVNHGYFSDLVKKNSMPSVEIVAKIADYLGVSIDYLLGRTDSPNISETYTNGDNSIQAVKNNGTVTISNTDNITPDFFEMFNKLNTEDKIRVMSYTLELTEKKQCKEQ